MRRVRVVAALDRRGISAAVARLRARRDVELELVAGAARAASSVWQRKAQLVIFELRETDAASSTTAGALDAIKALRAEPSSSALPILLLVSEGRPELREAGFQAGASDVCWMGGDPRGFEESLLHLAGIPIRRHVRRQAALPVRVSIDGGEWRGATALNLSQGGLQLRWEGLDVPPRGKVLRVELAPETSPVFASVQGGTRTGGSLLTRLRFVGLSPDERARLESMVAALPGPDEPEPELTPIPDEDPPADLTPPRFQPTRAMWVLALGALLAAFSLAAHLATRGPLEEPARVSLGSGDSTK